VHEPVALQAPERVREHLLRGTPQVVVEAAVAVDAAGQEVEQIDLPFRGQQVARSAGAVDHFEVLAGGSTCSVAPAAAVARRQVMRCSHHLLLLPVCWAAYAASSSESFRRRSRSSVSHCSHSAPPSRTTSSSSNVRSLPISSPASIHVPATRTRRQTE